MKPSQKPQSKSILSKKKPVPEDFGMTMEEYKEAKERLAHFSETHRKQSYNSDLFIIVVSIFGAVLIGIGTEWVIKFIPLVREGLGPWVGVPSFFVLIHILCEYFNSREERRLRKELSKPTYRKVELYEQFLSRYQHTRESYWMSLRGERFEKQLAKLYRRLGDTVHQTKGSGDEGIDLILSREGKKTVVQCKGHKKPIGVGAVRDLYGAMIHTRAESAVLACPAGFTKGVRKFVAGKPIELITATDLVAMAEQTS